MGINDGYILGTSNKVADRLEKKHGKNFTTIDFELNENYNYEDTSAQPIGKLIVGNRSVLLSFGEISKVMETLEDAKLVFKTQYRLGLHKK
tara:strand:- start:104 stop:376 length:273 start_codon:yes stop_codon:yes gene_type:complete